RTQETLMKPRTALALAAVAGLRGPVFAQDVMRVTCSWSEVVANSITPVTAPNSILEPGEGALIHLSIMALHNGINAIGQTTTFVPPPPPGSGTIRAVGSFNYVLAGDNGAST